MSGTPDELYIRARRALLDALEALGEQRAAVVLVGAQAVYLHTGEATLAVAPFTTDADLVLDPARLTSEPALAAAMARGGFALQEGNVGVWRSTREDVTVDLLVPEAQSESGRRSAQLPEPHGDRVARRSRGLEGALVDRRNHEIVAREDGDTRRFTIAAASPAALLVAKLHKLADRRGDVRRLNAKDALDVLRLLQGTETDILADGMRLLRADTRSAAVTREAIGLLAELFGTDKAQGAQLVGDAVVGVEDPDPLVQSAVVLVNDLLETLKRS